MGLVFGPKQESHVSPPTSPCFMFSSSGRCSFWSCQDSAFSFFHMTAELPGSTECNLNFSRETGLERGGEGLKVGLKYKVGHENRQKTIIRADLKYHYY